MGFGLNLQATPAAHDALRWVPKHILCHAALSWPRRARSPSLAATPAPGSNHLVGTTFCYVKLRIKLWEKHLPDAADLSTATAPLGLEAVGA